MKACMTFLAAALAGASIALAAPTYLTPEAVAFAPDQSALYVAAIGGQAVVKVSPEGKVLATWPLKVSSFFGRGQTFPAVGVAVSPCGTYLYATGDGGNEGRIFKIDLKTGKILRDAESGNTPMAPVVSPDGKTLYVCNRFDSTVAAFDADSLKLKATAPVVREGVAAALGVGGGLLFVGNHLPNDPADVGDLVSAMVSVIDTASFKKRMDVRLPNGSSSVRGMAASPDGKFIYVTHSISRYQLPTTQLERGWMNTAGLSVLNGETGAYINSVLLDDVDLGAANPWGVTCSPDGQFVIVTHAGTREISVINRGELHSRLERVARGEKVTEVSKTAEDVPTDLSFLAGIRRRISFPADGPRGVVATDTTAYAAAYFADAVVAVNFADTTKPPAVYTLGEPVDLGKDRVHRGEMLFNDGSMCFQQWQSCATCHPDGRADGLNWDLMNDGIGNPKQTKSMYLSGFTPPTMITGIRKSMQHCNRAGLIHIQFSVRPEEDAICLDEYVNAMKAVVSPYLRASNKKAIANGKKLFEGKAGCAECHAPATWFTNMKSYNLGLGTGIEEGRAFDTPVLNEVWRTAPYLYDGRALTMEDLLTRWNPNDTHGATSELSKDELRDLGIYVLSL